MTKKEKNQYWMDLIQQCRVSGLSDKRWCEENGISSSSFYYHIRKLRQKTFSVPAPVQKAEDHHEVVPIHFNHMSSDCSSIQKQSVKDSAISLSFHGVTMEINNNADPAIITATLNALQQLC